MRNMRFKVCDCVRNGRFEVRDCMKKVRFEALSVGVGLGKGRVPKLKKRESMVFDHRGGGGGGGHPKPNLYSDSVFVVLIWPFSVQILKILSIKTIVKVMGGGQRCMVKDHTFAFF